MHTLSISLILLLCIEGFLGIGQTLAYINSQSETACHRALSFISEGGGGGIMYPPYFIHNSQLVHQRRHATGPLIPGLLIRIRSNPGISIGSESVLKIKMQTFVSLRSDPDLFFFLDGWIGIRHYALIYPKLHRLYGLFLSKENN